MESNQVVVWRVEGANGRGMYCSVWFECGLPCDENHPPVSADSLYMQNMLGSGAVVSGFNFGAPDGHRFGFDSIEMLRRWIYNDAWITALSDKGAVICGYVVPAEHVIVGRTQVTFMYEKAMCVSRHPLASLLES